MNIDNINQVINKLIYLIDKYGYSSFDPSDGLNSDLIKLLHLDESPLVARTIIKVNSILPISFRKFLNIKKTHNDPKVISDIIKSYLLCENSESTFEKKIELLSGILISEATKTNSGIGWGLKFPYSSRFFAYAFSPNLFTTLNVASALLYVYKRYPDLFNLKILRNVNNFIINDLGIIDTSIKDSYIRYYLGVDTPFINVNSLALKYFIEFQTITHSNDYNCLINKLLHFVTLSQNPDGSWFYAPVKKGRIIDGFHTGYIIEGLITSYLHFQDEFSFQIIQKANEYYRKKLFINNFPCYTPLNIYPIDSQNCAQAIQTRLKLCSIGIDNLESILEMTTKINKALYLNQTYFIYRRHRFLLNKQVYLRWSITPFLYSFCQLKQYLQSGNTQHITNFYKPANIN